MISAPIAAWTVTGTPSQQAGEQYGQLRVREGWLLLEGAAQCFAHAVAVRIAGGDGLVHPAACLFRHPERSVAQTSRDILRRRAESRHLIVVDGS